VSILRVWYPGPSVSKDVAHEAQNHSRLGRIEPGWNELQDGDDLRAALAAGLFALEQLAVSLDSALGATEALSKAAHDEIAEPLAEAAANVTPIPTRARKGQDKE